MAAILPVTPAESAWRFACSVLLGMALGTGYDFLRPLGRKHPHLADLLFAPVLFWGWLYVSFAVCRCDIRVVYTLGMLAGLVVWECTAARWLQPLCFFFWQRMEALACFLLIPWKKFLKIVKNLFASAKKWSTIKCNDRRKRRSTGGSRYGKDHRYAQPCEAGIQAHQ